ncbi:hypothetical protein TSARBOMBA_86 [Bacillus phage TsarBomba]|uniref:Uncharacterized protein n=1 Tax=Bacillus phage TsarBomba TaxID=1690456 RepID=A0A0K2D0A0_9CAUD|nr:hypothetical protein TSARBOMBA_86 [Bacillus phage TsarBomba]ALA13016.1 hypothetical protein TSARBOMBA_86 [Bacillus phage TsarBomba]
MKERDKEALLKYRILYETKQGSGVTLEMCGGFIKDNVTFYIGKGEERHMTCLTLETAKQLSLDLQRLIEAKEGLEY